MKIGLDTNVLVRWLTQDDVAQCARIRVLFEKYANQPECFYINEIVLCETLWVLQSAFDYDKQSLMNLLNSLLCNTSLSIENESLMTTALSLYENSSAGFADCLISVKNTSVNCDMTVSFDKAAGRLPFMNLL